jgi:hypothetical protein
MHERKNRVVSVCRVIVDRGLSRDVMRISLSVASSVLIISLSFNEEKFRSRINPTF